MLAIRNSTVKRDDEFFRGKDDSDAGRTLILGIISDFTLLDVYDGDRTGEGR
jgi:hypothetical protein